MYTKIQNISVNPLNNFLLNKNFTNSCCNPDLLNPTLLNGINSNFIDQSTLLSYPYFINPNVINNNSFYLNNLQNQLTVKRTLQDFQPPNIIGSTISLESEHMYDSKKSKLEVTNTEPSRVLHIRNIAARAQESDLTILAVPFGKIKCMVYAKKTNQALMEMTELKESTRMFDYYSQFPPGLNGRQMIVQYSRHNSLELKLQNALVDNSVQQANKMVDEHCSRVKEWMIDSKSHERRILRIVIENCRDTSITHIMILKVFQRFGKVQRIIIFNKNMQCQCLVEMENGISAHVALLHLNGQDLFPDSCKLRVEFSRNSDSLQIQRQNDKCRDYVLTPLTEEEQIYLNLLDYPQPQLSLNSTPNQLFTANNGFTISGFPHDSFVSGNYSNLINGLDLPQTVPTTSVDSNSTANSLQLNAKQPTTSIYNYSNDAAAINNTYLALMPLINNALSYNPSLDQFLGSPVYSSAILHHNVTHNNPHPNPNGLLHHNQYNSHQHNHLLMSSSSVSPVSSHNNNGQTTSCTSAGTNVVTAPLISHIQQSSLFISNLNTEKINLEHLFNLFGIYGNVIKVSINRSGMNIALVIMESPLQSDLACKYLNGITIYGKSLVISVVQPNDNTTSNLVLFSDPNTVISKDYGYNNSEHRYKVGSLFPKFYAPSAQLILTNIPVLCSGDSIIQLIANFHCKFKSVQIIDSRPLKSVIVDFDSIEDAIVGLINLHGCKLSLGEDNPSQIIQANFHSDATQYNCHDNINSNNNNSSSNNNNNKALHCYNA